MSILPSSDSALVAQALADRSAAFEKLVLRYQRRAHAIARACGVPPDSLDDVVQEAFLQAFCGLRELRSPASFGAWFLNIVRNLARGHLRKSKGASTRVPSDLDSLEGPAAGSADARDLSDHVQREVARLPEPIREVLFLYYYEGASVRRVSQSLAISHSAVKSRLKRGRDVLRDRLWRDFEESIREKVPSAREWKRKGRKLSFFLMASVRPRHPTLAASEAHASTEACSLSTYVSAGAFLMGTKKLLVLVGLATILVGAGLVYLTDLPTTPEETSRDPGKPVVSSVEPTTEEKTPIAPPPAPVRTGVTGTVYFGDSLAPAPDIHVTAIVDRTREHSEVTTTDQDGRYVLSHLQPGEYRVVAWREEWTTEWNSNDVVDVKAKKLAEGIDITLVPGVIVRGQVVEERTGRPIGDAEVSAHFQIATTDEEGHFSLEGVPEGLIDVSARATGFARRWFLVDIAHGEEPLVTVELARGGVVEGTVTTWEGEPAAGVEVSASGENGGGSARTDAGGHYHIEGIPLTSHDISLSASRGGYFATRRRTVPGFSPGETRLVVDLRLEEGYILRGHVLDPNLQPVSGAKLHILGSIIFSKTLESDDEGRFVIEGASDRMFIVTARREGYAPASVDLRNLSPEAREDVELVLPVGHTVSGRVVDSQGVPIEEATVYVDAAMRGAGPAHSTLTDEEGRFLIVDLPAELDYIGALKSGYADSRWNPVGADQEDIRLVLEEAGQIRGVVVDSASGESIHPFVVKVAFAQGRFRERNKEKNFSGGLRSSMGNGLPYDFADGSFSIRNGLASGIFYELVVVADGYAEAVLDGIEARPRSTSREPLRVGLLRGGRLRGTVFATTGKPLHDVRVTYVGHGHERRWDYWSAYGHREEAAVRVAVTDEHGEFMIDGLPSETGVLLLEKNGFARTVILRVRPNDAAVFELPPAAVVEGVVQDTEGNPLPGAQVRVSVNDQPFPETTTNAEGAYRAVDLPSGEAELKLSRNGMFEILRTVTLTAGEVTTVDFTQSHGSITGRVTDGGKPVGQARILVTSLANPRENDWIYADAQGIFRVGGLADGAYRLRASRPEARGPLLGGVTRTVDVTGEEVRCDISLSPGFRVSGQVVDRVTRSPVYGSTITLFRHDPDFLSSGGIKGRWSEWVPCGSTKTQNGNNRFSLEIPMPGSYVVYVVAVGAGEQQSRGWLGPVELTPSSPTRDLVVQLGGSPGLLVDVRDGESSPLEHAKVRLIRLGYPIYSPARTDASGQAVLRNLPAGRYRLEVESAKHSLFEETLKLSDTLVKRTVSLQLASWLVVDLEGDLDPGRDYIIRATVLAGDDPGWMLMTRVGDRAVTTANFEMDGHGSLRVRLKTRPGSYRIRFDVGAGRYSNSPVVLSQERAIALLEGSEVGVTLSVAGR